MHRERGFTVPELIVVIIVLLGFALTLALLRPKQFTGQEYASQQKTNVARIMQLIERYKQDQGGLPAGFPTQETPISSIDGYDLCTFVVPAYGPDLPIDEVDGIKALDNSGLTDKPCNAEGVTYSTGYFVSQDDKGRVTVSSQNASTGKIYSLTR